MRLVISVVVGGGLAILGSRESMVECGGSMLLAIWLLGMVLRLIVLVTVKVVLVVSMVAILLAVLII